MGRKRERPNEFLKNYNGILQTDGYSAYGRVGYQGFVPTGCWAHARRKVYEALQIAPKNVQAAAIMQTLGELYEIERKAREGCLDAEKRLALRKERSVALLGELKALITKAKSSALPQSALG